MAVIDAFKNNVLPYPIFGLPYTFVFPILDADGDLVTGAASDTPDTELSKDGDTFTDRAELVELATSSGMYYVSLTAAEMTCSIGSLILKTATAGTKTTPLVFYPRVLVQHKSGTASAGAAGTITLAAGSSDKDDHYNGAIVYIHTGTGAGQVRTITDYVGGTLIASVTPNFATNPSNDSEYYIYLTDTYPNHSIENEILRSVETIAVTGSALNAIAESDTLTTGTQSSGTYANTATHDGVYHVITAASNEIDIYYEFDIGATGVPVSVAVGGYLKEGPPAGGDTIDLKAYNWGGTAFEVVHADIFTGITSDTEQHVTANLLSRHVGTNGNEGKVRLQFQATSLEAGTTLNIDELILSYAESVAADVAAILDDTGTNGVVIVNDGITKLKFDESTAWPLLAADTGATQVARVGADSDTLETLSDEIAAISGGDSAADIAGAVWDEDLTDHKTVDTAGEILQGIAGDWEITGSQLLWKSLDGTLTRTYNLTRDGTATEFNPTKRELV